MRPCIPLITMESGDTEQQSLLARVPPINLFRALVHAPSLAARVAALGHALNTQTELSGRDIELIALRCGARLRSDYVVHLHRHVARSLGLDAEQIAAAEGRIPQAS